MEENKIINETQDAEPMTDDKMKELIEAEMKKIQLANLLRGSKAICGVILQFIVEFNSQPGKRSMNDYRRLVKKISDFCSQSLSKVVDENNNIIDTKDAEEVAE